MLNKVFIILNLLFLFRILWLSDWHSGDQHLIPGFSMGNQISSNTNANISDGERFERFLNC